MFALLSDTGFGSCLIIIIAMVGIPLVWRADAKKKPEVAAPGQNIEN